MSIASRLATSAAVAALKLSFGAVVEKGGIVSVVIALLLDEFAVRVRRW
jgi:hypothetical protein